VHSDHTKRRLAPEYLMRTSLLDDKLPPRNAGGSTNKRKDE